MQIVQSTIIVLALMAFMVARGPYRGLVVFMAVTPMGMMAAFNLPAVGGTSILAIDLAVVTMFVMMLLRRGVQQDILSVLAPGGPAIMLMFFLCYAAVATMFFPRVFEGQTEVFSLSRTLNVDGIVSSPLRPSAGNLSQLLRMMLSLGAFLIAAVLIRRNPDADLILLAIKVATAVHVTVGVVDILTNSAGIAFLLEPIRTANYALTLGQKMSGINRMIGGFPEASAFGYYSVGLFGFWLSYWFTDRGSKSRTWIWLAATTFVLLRSTSSSAYVGAAGFCLVFVAFRFFSVNQGHGGMMARRSAAIVMSLVALVPFVILGGYALYSLVPDVSDFVDRSLLNKLSSDSGVERMGWNAQAFRNFLDTYMLGAGLGSVRASNWVLAGFGTVGLPGTILLILFLWRMFRAQPTNQDEQTQRVFLALKMGCAGFLMRALVVSSTPNLEHTFFAMAGFVVGLAATSGKLPVQRPVFVSQRAR